MEKNVKYVGLDVHKNSIAIAIADEGRNGAVRMYGEIPNTPEQIDKFIKLPAFQNSELHFVYEAGPCGYTVYRHLKNRGLECVVIAPSLIPKKPGNRIKNDRRDAKNLALLHRAGELTPVYVPEPEDEAIRDLLRTRQDIQDGLKKVKQQINGFLLRQGMIYTGKTRWSKTHMTWLKNIKMPHALQQLSLTEYLGEMEDREKRLQRIDKSILNACQTWRLYPYVKSLQALRGVALFHAVTIVAEGGDLSRFDKATQFMGYAGVVPSEHSSGGSVKRGAITKTGNSQLRKALIEAAHAYNKPARNGATIRKRQEDLPDEVCEIAWNAQTRLCGRYRLMTARGKNYNRVITAIARELCGFIWAIARTVNRQT